MNMTPPFDAEALRRRAAALDDLHAMLAAEALGRRLDDAMSDRESSDPHKLPDIVREPAERAIAAAEEAMEMSLDRALAVEVARMALAAAAETPAAMGYLAAALDEAEAPPRTLFVPDPISIGAGISLIIFVSKLNFDFKFGSGRFGKGEVGDEVLVQLASSLIRIAEAAVKLLPGRSGD